MERLVFWPATVLQAIKRWRDINNYDLEARVDGSESKGKNDRTIGIHVGDPSTHAKQGLERYFRDPGFDQNMVRDMGKCKLS